MLRPLKRYQRHAIKFLKQAVKSHGGGILALAPGTGKTLVTIRATSFLSLKPPYLVICRRDDFLTWKLELTSEGVCESQMWFIDHQSAIDLEFAYEHCIWVFTTYDLVRNATIKNFIESYPWDLVIGDEVHAIKRWESQRTKAVIRSTQHIPNVIGLTGTPLTNNPLDVFSICQFADKGKTFGTSEWGFLKRYFLHDGQYGWYLRKKAKDVEIPQKLKPIMIHVHEDDVLSLPPHATIVKAVPLSPQQQQAYNRVLYEWELAIAQDKILEINYIVVQLQKLKQIASGFYYDEFGQATRLDCTKLELLLNMAKNSDYLGEKPKVVVWCSYTDEIMRIQESLMALDDGGVCLLYGQMTRAQREESRLKFRDDRKQKWFVGQVDAGVGMNELVVADTAIYFSNSFKVVSKQQSMRRIRRIGSEVHNRITYYELVSEKTVDEKTLKGVNSAMSLAQGILNQLKRGVPLRQVI